MSENIPLEIQYEIIKRLPVKSVIQFRSVSKTWKSLIDSSDFITDYIGQTQHLLVSYRYYSTVDSKPKYVLIADDKTFPQHKLPLTEPQLDNMFNYYGIIGTSHGLICFYNAYNIDDSGFRKPVALVIWNPCVRKAFVVAVDDVLYGVNEVDLGFGVCRETRDPKVFKLTYIKRVVGDKSIEFIPDQVVVFTLSGGVWRSSSGNLPRKSVYIRFSRVFVDGFLYFLATDRDSTVGCDLIVSFDMTSEEFSEVKLPLCLAHDGPNYGLSVSKLRESLVVLERGGVGGTSVWMLEDGVQKSFTKLFTIDIDTRHGGVMGFRKSGEPIVKILEDDSDIRKLFVYEPCSKRVDNLQIDRIEELMCVQPYVETLLLLNQPNGKRFCFGN